MPFFDQHWQLRWLGAGLAAIAAVLLPLRYLHVAQIYDHLRGWDMRPDIVFAGVTAVTLLGVAFLLARSAPPARARQQWRIERLTTGAPLTQHPAVTSTASDPAVPEDSVITVQRISRVERIVAWMFVPWLIGGILVTPFVLEGAVNILINPMAPDVAGDTTPAFVFLLLVPVMVGSLWAVGTLASDAWASPARFEVDALGITQIPAGEGHVTIRWQDARLLEKVTYRRPEGRGSARVEYYLLYGDDTVIRIDPKGSFSGDVRPLLARIEEHTGLVPCQFGQPGVR